MKKVHSPTPVGSRKAWSIGKSSRRVSPTKRGILDPLDNKFATTAMPTRTRMDVVRQKPRNFIPAIPGPTILGLSPCKGEVGCVQRVCAATHELGLVYMCSHLPRRFRLNPSFI